MKLAGNCHRSSWGSGLFPLTSFFFPLFLFPRLQVRLDNYFPLNVSADISDVYQTSCTKRINSNLKKHTFSLVDDKADDYTMPTVQIEIHSIIVWKN